MKLLAFFALPLAVSAAPLTKTVLYVTQAPIPDEIVSNDYVKAEAAAKEDPDSAATAKLQAQADEARGKVDTLVRGETLRGLLLTSYGFSVFGERAAQAALVAFLAAAVLGLASIAGFAHAFSKAGDEVIE